MVISCEERRCVAVLGAFALFLSAVEYMIPKPLPFLRLGLANLPLLLALKLRFRSFALLALIKVTGQALLAGTLFSPLALFSLAGTAASSMAMLAVSRLPAGYAGWVGISVAGALASNGAQILLARAIVLGSGARFIAPPLFAAGLVTGAALGVFCERFTRHSSWYRASIAEPAATAFVVEPPEAKPRTAAQYFSLAAVFAGAAALLAAPSLSVRLALAGAFWLIAALRGRAGQPLITVLSFAGITAFNLLTPYGREIAAVGPLSVTSGALRTGLDKAAVIEGLLMISRGMLPRNLTLPGRFGALLSETLTILAVISAERGTLSFKKPFEALDALLWKCSSHDLRLLSNYAIDNKDERTRR